MHRFNDPTISSNFYAFWMRSKQTVIMAINIIVTTSKPNHSNTNRAFVLIATPTRI